MTDESYDEGIDGVIGEEKCQVASVGALTRTLQGQFHKVNTINTTDAFYHKVTTPHFKYIFPYFSMLNL